jgi:hypothetical protein
MQVRRNLAVVQNQRCLDQARDSGGRLEMTDIGLQ